MFAGGGDEYTVSLGLNDNLTGPLRSAGAAVSLFEGNLASALSRMGGLTIGVGAITAIGAGFISAASAAASVQQNVANLNAVLRATPDQIARIRAEGLKLSQESQFTDAQIVRGQQQLARAYQDTAQIIQNSRQVVALAGAAQIDPQQAAALYTNAQKAFRLGNQESEASVNTLAQALNSSQGTVAEFTTSFRQIAPVANSAHISLKETATAIADLSQSGLRGDAGTALKTFLMRIEDPSKQAKEAMRQLGLQFYDTQGKMLPLPQIMDELRIKMAGLSQETRDAATGTIFGMRGARVADIYAEQGSRGYAETTQFMSQQGDAAEINARKLNTLEGSVKKLSSSMNVLAVQIGTNLIPGLKSLADLSTGALNAVTGTGAGGNVATGGLALVGEGILARTLAGRRADRAVKLAEPAEQRAAQTESFLLKEEAAWQASALKVERIEAAHQVKMAEIVAEGQLRIAAATANNPVQSRAQAAAIAAEQQTLARNIARQEATMEAQILSAQVRPLSGPPIPPNLALVTKVDQTALAAARGGIAKGLGAAAGLAGELVLPVLITLTVQELVVNPAINAYTRSRASARVAPESGYIDLLQTAGQTGPQTRASYEHDLAVLEADRRYNEQALAAAKKENAGIAGARPPSALNAIPVVGALSNLPFFSGAGATAVVNKAGVQLPGQIEAADAEKNLERIRQDEEKLKATMANAPALFKQEEIERGTALANEVMSGTKTVEEATKAWTKYGTEADGVMLDNDAVMRSYGFTEKQIQAIDTAMTKQFIENGKARQAQLDAEEEQRLRQVDELKKAQALGATDEQAVGAVLGKDLTGRAITKEQQQAYVKGIQEISQAWQTAGTAVGSVDISKGIAGLAKDADALARAQSRLSAVGQDNRHLDRLVGISSEFKKIADAEDAATAAFKGYLLTLDESDRRISFLDTFTQKYRAAIEQAQIAQAYGIATPEQLQLLKERGAVEASISQNRMALAQAEAPDILGMTHNMPNLKQADDLTRSIVGNNGKQIALDVTSNAKDAKDEIDKIVNGPYKDIELTVRVKNLVGDAISSYGTPDIPTENRDYTTPGVGSDRSGTSGFDATPRQDNAYGVGYDASGTPTTATQQPYGAGRVVDPSTSGGGSGVGNNRYIPTAGGGGSSLAYQPLDQGSFSSIIKSGAGSGINANSYAAIMKAAQDHNIDPRALLAFTRYENVSPALVAANNYGGIKYTGQQGATQGPAAPRNEGGNYAAFSSPNAFFEEIARLITSGGYEQFYKSGNIQAIRQRYVAGDNPPSEDQKKNIASTVSTYQGYVQQYPAGHVGEPGIGPGRYYPGSATGSTSTASTTNRNTSAILNDAKKHLNEVTQIDGKPWDWWCEKFVDDVIQRVTGTNYRPATADKHLRDARAGVKQAGTIIDATQRQVGDLVAWSGTSKEADTPGGEGHIGIYSGNDRYIGTTPEGIKERPLPGNQTYIRPPGVSSQVITPGIPSRGGTINTRVGLTLTVPTPDPGGRGAKGIGADQAAAMRQRAVQLSGTAYTYGGGHSAADTGGFDCSGYVMDVLRAGGVSVPWTDAGGLYKWAQTGEGAALLDAAGIELGFINPGAGGDKEHVAINIGGTWFDDAGSRGSAGVRPPNAPALTHVVPLGKQVSSSQISSRGAASGYGPGTYTSTGGGYQAGDGSGYDIGTYDASQETRGYIDPGKLPPPDVTGVIDRISKLFATMSNVGIANTESIFNRVQPALQQQALSSLPSNASGPDKDQARNDALEKSLALEEAIAQATADWEHHTGDVVGDFARIAQIGGSIGPLIASITKNKLQVEDAQTAIKADEAAIKNIDKVTQARHKQEQIDDQMTARTKTRQQWAQQQADHDREIAHRHIQEQWKVEENQLEDRRVAESKAYDDAISNENRRHTVASRHLEDEMRATEKAQREQTTGTSAREETLRHQMQTSSGPARFQAGERLAIERDYDTRSLRANRNLLENLKQAAILEQRNTEDTLYGLNESHRIATFNFESEARQASRNHEKIQIQWQEEADQQWQTNFDRQKADQEHQWAIEDQRNTQDQADQAAKDAAETKLQQDKDNLASLQEEGKALDDAFTRWTNLANLIGSQADPLLNAATSGHSGGGGGGESSQQWGNIPDQSGSPAADLLGAYGNYYGSGQGTPLFAAGGKATGDFGIVGDTAGGDMSAAEVVNFATRTVIPHSVAASLGLLGGGLPRYAMGTGSQPVVYAGDSGGGDTYHITIQASGNTQTDAALYRKFTQFANDRDRERERRAIGRGSNTRGSRVA